MSRIYLHEEIHSNNYLHDVSEYRTGRRWFDPEKASKYDLDSESVPSQYCGYYDRCDAANLYRTTSGNWIINTWRYNSCGGCHSDIFLAVEDLKDVAHMMAKSDQDLTEYPELAEIVAAAEIS